MKDLIDRLEHHIRIGSCLPGEMIDDIRAAIKEIKHLRSLAGSVSEGKDFRTIRNELDHG
jgi:hypothetical protein